MSTVGMDWWDAIETALIRTWERHGFDLMYDHSIIAVNREAMGQVDPLGQIEWHDDVSGWSYAMAPGALRHSLASAFGPVYLVADDLVPQGMVVVFEENTDKAMTHALAVVELDAA